MSAALLTGLAELVEAFPCSSAPHPQRREGFDKLSPAGIWLGAKH
jgi:hypothetical protein